MGSTKHTSITVSNLRVTGEFVHDNAPAVAAVTAHPVAEYPAPLPSQLTMAALRDRQDYLIGVLVQAGLIADPVEREDAPTDPVEPVDAPTDPVDPAVPAQPAEATPQAVTAGVVDGA